MQLKLVDMRSLGTEQIINIERHVSFSSWCGDLTRKEFLYAKTRIYGPDL